MNRDPALSLGCPHPSRRNQVPTGDNATAALILSTTVTDIGVASVKGSRCRYSEGNERGGSQGRKKRVERAEVGHSSHHICSRDIEWEGDADRNKLTFGVWKNKF